MYFILNKEFVLRGWSDVPYVLCNTSNAEIYLLSEIEYRALSFCNGFIHSESFLITYGLRKIIDKFISNKIVSTSENESSIADFQMYKIYPTRFIRSAHWSITGKCNYNCRHCLISAPSAALGEISLESCFKIIDDLHNCGVMFLSITGGEPLIRNDFFDIIDRALEKNIVITSIYSNGKLITPQLLDEFEKRGITPEINISFDGVGWHDWLRGEKGAEKYALDTFKLCVERGFVTVSEMCIHKLNKHTIRDTVNLLASIGVKSLKIGSVIPAGEWASDSLKYTLSHEEVFDTFLDYIKLYYEDDMPMNVKLGGLFTADVENKKFRIPFVRDTDCDDISNACICGHAKNNIYIGADGKALPCMPLANSAFSSKCPDVTQLGLYDTLNDPFFNKIINVTVGEFLDNNSECAQCSYQYLCQGGCRGLAIESENDDYFLNDKQACFFFKNGYVQKVETLISQLR